MRDHGGVYLDVDCIPLLPLDEWLPKVISVFAIH